MADTIRTFIALELSSEIKDELAKLQGELKSARADVKWVNPAAIHITLKFLGNIYTSEVAARSADSSEVASAASGLTIQNITPILDTIASRHAKFELSLFQIGGFPRLEHPRVIWVGLDKGCAQAEALAKDVEEELQANSLSPVPRSGIPPSGKGGEGQGEGANKWTAHITLGRVKSPKGIKDLVSKIKTLDFRPGAVCVIDKVILFQSTLTPHGSIYTPLHEAHLI